MRPRPSIWRHPLRWAEWGRVDRNRCPETTVNGLGEHVRCQVGARAHLQHHSGGWVWSTGDIAVWVALGRLMGGWRPTREQLRALDNQPAEVIAALRSVSRGWSPDDARWDVLLGLFEWFGHQRDRYTGLHG